MSEMEIYRRLGLAAAKRRKQLELTQAEVAAEIGLTRASLANIETGRQKVLLHHVYRLASALKLESILDLLPPMFLFGDQSQPVTISGAPLSDQQKAQIEHFFRIADKR